MSSSNSQIDDLLASLGFAPLGNHHSHSRAETEPDDAPAVAVLEPEPESMTPGEAILQHFRPDAAASAPSAQAPSSQELAAQREMFRKSGKYFPFAPETLAEAGLHTSEVSDLILKYMSIRGVESGFNIARQLGMKFPPVEGILRQLKTDRLVTYKTTTAGGDYLYELTNQGRERAGILYEHSSYVGAAPVPLEQYIRGVKAQSLEGRKPSLEQIRAAFDDLQVGEKMISSIGQAIHSGRGMFLFGPAGNGKTSMAERITRSFGDTIWIPRSLVAAGEIIRLFDPHRHRAVAAHGCDPEIIDGRWVLIERPTIIAGGELRMDNLEVTYIRNTGVGEAPLQLKANCGTLLIDDFGRQRMSIDELLNRWIVPLEQRHDYLHLESGRSIQVPFDQLIIFSSNLEPKDLVDEAFLRRIPYKIEVKNPSEADFRKLFMRLCEQLNFSCGEAQLNYLVQRHFLQPQRPFRFCYSRDLLRQIENRCTLHSLPREVTEEALDLAVENYFSIM